jgi:hypothetical protein
MLCEAYDRSRPGPIRPVLIAFPIQPSTFLHLGSRSFVTFDVTPEPGRDGFGGLPVYPLDDV